MAARFSLAVYGAGGGEPIFGASVSVYLSGDLTKGLDTPVARAKTDETGSVSLNGLQAGTEYRLVVVPPAERAAELQEVHRAWKASQGSVEVPVRDSPK